MSHSSDKCGAMPIDVTYDDVDEVEDQPKTKKNSSAPKLDDSSAFPEAAWGSGSAAAPGMPSGGKSMAALAAETLPEQRIGIDLNQPIVIKMPRPPTKSRLQKVREAYKKDDRKKLNSTFKVWHDEGIPAGVSEKKAELTMQYVSPDVADIKDFDKAFAAAQKLSLDEGANIRVFRGDIAEPSPDSDNFVKGGRYQIRVGKPLSPAMFEELCLYLFDSRLDAAIVGVCWCLRANFDLLQMWTKKEASSSSIDVFSGKICSILGTTAKVTYTKHAELSKSSKPRKYYLIEGSSDSSEHGAAMSVESVIQPREFGKKKERKVVDDYTEVQNSNKKAETKQVKVEAPKETVVEKPSGVTTAANAYGSLFDGDNVEEAEEEAEDIQIFEKKKSDKRSNKQNSRKGSKKEKKASTGFDELPPVAAPVISQQMFVGAGFAGILMVAMLAIFLSGVFN